jgi:hypothetical protein
VSYWHAYEVVRAHGESGVTARLEPATIDGLVYASSMVVLYAARHQLAVPALARWLLAMGILATLAANVAHGWPNGPIGAAVAAWPAASLVGSYELLLWLVRTAATGAAAREPAADQESGPVDHLVRELRLVPMPDAVGAEHDGASGNHAMPGGHKDRCVVPAGTADRTSGPDRTRRTGPRTTKRPAGPWRAQPPALARTSMQQQRPPTGPVSAPAGRYRSGSSRQCSARPHVAGPATAWPRLARTSCLPWRTAGRPLSHPAPRSSVRNWYFAGSQYFDVEA